jgi:hypothetical protein
VGAAIGQAIAEPPDVWSARLQAVLAVGDSKTGAIPSTPMAAVVQLIPYDDRGREIIEKLEEEGTQEPRLEIRKYGTREYNLRARNLGMVGFDAMLNRIDPDWREHLGRTA